MNREKTQEIMIRAIKNFGLNKIIGARELLSLYNKTHHTEYYKLHINNVGMAIKTVSKTFHVFKCKISGRT